MGIMRLTDDINLDAIFKEFAQGDLLNSPSPIYDDFINSTLPQMFPEMFLELTSDECN
jgi:hypothetical protein